MFKDVYHIGLQTDDADAAIAFAEKAFGGRVTNESRNPDGSRLVFMRWGNTDVEIIQPGDKSVLAGKTGFILHHIGYTVDKIDDSLAELEGKGMKRLWPEARTNVEGARVQYMDPASMNGLNMHLTERPKS
jgi:methylmalonyl-CoA/ethylmalonyl-CoA epimerase